MSLTTFTINNHPITLDLRDEADASVAAEIFKVREYRVAEKVITASTLPIVDVGAHAGFFSIYARTLNPSVPIIAIEPEPKNQTALLKNLQDNTVTGVTLIKGALTKERGKRELIRTSDSHNHFLKVNARQIGSITVEGYHLKSLAKYWPQGIGLVKMDIEGGEYEIFANLRPDDFLSIRAIVMEYHDIPGHKHQEIEQILRENGFGVQTFPSKFDKTMGFFWATNKRTVI